MDEQKRGNPRFPADPPIRVSMDLPSGQHVRNAVDLSAGGIQLFLDSPVEIGTSLHLELKLSPVASTIQTVGTVRWCNPSETGCRVGIEFESISNNHRKVLDEALDWQSMQALEDSECVVLPLRGKANVHEDQRFEYCSDDGECIVFPFSPEARDHPVEESAHIKADRQAAMKEPNVVMIKGLDGEEVKLRSSKAVFWR